MTTLSKPFLISHFGAHREGYDWPVRSLTPKGDDGITIPTPPQTPQGFQHVGGIRTLALNLDIEPGDFDYEETFAERGLRMLPFVTVSFFVVLIGACIIAAGLR